MVSLIPEYVEFTENSIFITLDQYAQRQGFVDFADLDAQADEGRENIYNIERINQFIHRASRSIIRQVGNRINVSYMPRLELLCYEMVNRMVEASVQYPQVAFVPTNFLYSREVEFLNHIALERGNTVVFSTRKLDSAIDHVIDNSSYIYWQPETEFRGAGNDMEIDHVAFNPIDNLDHLAPSLTANERSRGTLNLTHGICPICQLPLQLNEVMRCIECNTEMRIIDKFKNMKYGRMELNILQQKYLRHKKPTLQPKEFKVSELITLKLEHWNAHPYQRLETNIYIKGVKFRQCKYLLLNLEKGKSYKSIESIDEAKELLSNEMEGSRHDSTANKYHITPEEEFQGHCSNIQAWYENGYDLRIIHTNLGYPLLSKLAEHDPTAKHLFREQICERVEKGGFKAFKTLEKYIRIYFTEEERDHLWSMTF